MTYWWSGDNIELPMISVLCAEKGKRRGERKEMNQGLCRTGVHLPCIILQGPVHHSRPQLSAGRKFSGGMEPI